LFCFLFAKLEILFQLKKIFLGFLKIISGTGQHFLLEREFVAEVNLIFGFFINTRIMPPLLEIY